MSNIQVVRKTIVTNLNKTLSSWKRNGASLPPPLDKFEKPEEDGIVIVDPPPFSDVPVYSSYLSADLINEQVRELQVCVFTVYRQTRSSIFFSFPLDNVLNLEFSLQFCFCVVSATRLCSNGDRNGKTET